MFTMIDLLGIYWFTQKYHNIFDIINEIIFTIWSSIAVWYKIFMQRTLHGNTLVKKKTVK